jgi:hypothetical protein
MAKGSATEVASIGPITITYAFRSWVLVEAPGGDSLRRRVRSDEQLAEVLKELGVPANEAGSVAARLWAARPSDAGLSKVSPWESFASSTGYSRLKLFLAAVAIVVVAGLILWLVYG